MKRIALTSLALAAVSLSVAFPAYLGVFTKKYAVKKDSALGKASCAGCHVGKTAKLNPYALDLQKVTKGSKTITNEMLAKVEDLDSDKDGVKNGVELKAGALPGDPKVKPE